MEKPPMILRDGRWETAPPEAAPEPEQAPGPYGRPKKKRKKRRVTEAMRKANESNSKHSTGHNRRLAGRTRLVEQYPPRSYVLASSPSSKTKTPDAFWANVQFRADERNVTTLDELTLIVAAEYSWVTPERLAVDLDGEERAPEGADSLVGDGPREGARSGR